MADQSKTGKAKKADIKKKADKSERADKEKRSTEKPEKPAKIEKPDKSDKAVTSTERPEKPDEKAYQSELDAANKDLEAIRVRVSAQSGLLAEQSEIRKKLQGLKDAGNKVFDQIKRLDEKLKSLLNENKIARSQVSYKSIAEVDAKIERLEKSIKEDKLTLVNENKAVAEIGILQKSKKFFETFDRQQKHIDDVKAQIAQLKKSGDSPETKILNDRYNAIQAQIDQMNKASGATNVPKPAAGERKNELNDARNRIKEINDKYYTARSLFRDWDIKQKQAKRERDAAEKAAYEAKKRREIAQRKLEEASSPAYQDEIFTSETLIRHFDPSAAPPKQDRILTVSSKFAAVASRTIEEDTPKGMTLVKKDNDDDYFTASSAGARKKKSSSSSSSKKRGEASGSEKLHLSSAVIESLAKIGVDPPAGLSYVPATIANIQEKVKVWKSDQKRKTDENIAKAQKEIEKLEVESSPSTPVNLNIGAKDTHKKPAIANLGLNGKVSAEAELNQEEDAVADVAGEVEKLNMEVAAASA